MIVPHTCNALKPEMVCPSWYHTDYSLHPSRGADVECVGFNLAKTAEAPRQAQTAIG